MKLFIIILTILSMCLYGCNQSAKHNQKVSAKPEAHAGHEHSEHKEHDHKGHNHEGHDHEGHDHAAHAQEVNHDSHEGHNHATEGHDHAAEGAGHDHSHESTEANHNDEIIFTKEQAAKTDFEVRKIQPGTFHQVIKTTGQVLPAPGDESVIVATNNGVVSFANHNLAAGSAVKQGQPLFHIASKNLSEGDYYARTDANYQKAKAEYERAQKLIQDKIISQKEYEAIRLNYQNARIAYDAIAGKQSAKGMAITAPFNGYVKNITVQDGEYVTAGQAIATISQNKRLVLRADVSEKHYPVLHSIHSANFKTPYDNQVYDLADLSGKLLSVGKSAANNTFFIPVTFEFNNQGAVIPGTFVEIYLISAPLPDVLSIPVSALTNEMGTFYVYKQLDEEGYQKQEVKTGANNGKEVQILSGLHPGDRVVTKGAYQVKMASASAAIPGHTHEH